MRIVAIVLVVAATLIRPSFAQVPSGNVYFGYAYLNADTNFDRINTNGWDASIEGKFFPFIGLVADIGRTYADQNICTSASPVTCSPTLNGRLDTYLFGPRLSVSVGRVRPFAHALFGVAHTETSGSFFSDTAFATAIGGGADIGLIPLLAVRGQVDFLQSRLLDNTQNNVRFTTGLVLRF